MNLPPIVIYLSRQLLYQISVRLTRNLHLLLSFSRYPRTRYFGQPSRRPLPVTSCVAFAYHTGNGKVCLFYLNRILYRRGNYFGNIHTTRLSISRQLRTLRAEVRIPQTPAENLSQLRGGSSS